MRKSKSLYHGHRFPAALIGSLDITPIPNGNTARAGTGFAAIGEGESVTVPGRLNSELAMGS